MFLLPGNFATIGPFENPLTVPMSRIIRLSLPRPLRVLAATLALITGLTALPAGAGVDEARRMLDEGRAAEALRIVDERLRSAPQDAELRFLRGLALSRIGRHEEAIDTFAALTRDYPQLPEPYNNLAVIYAQKGDYERARDALEAALATHPSYATAHENLGDLYAAMASAAYNRAMLLDEQNPALERKLRVMEELSGARGTTTARVAQDAPAAAPPSADDAPAPAREAPAPARADSATLERISEAVFRWASAWQAQDVDGYLAAYAPDFSPSGGMGRQEWAEQRRQRVRAPSYIRVAVRDPDISMVDSDRARVVFTQEYESDTYQGTTDKTLELRRVGDRWLIVRETTS